ncbi:MAG: hypothetical protein PVJ57_08510 [Phycisphaerae bacterium]|jgi:hypothetical protein
MDEQQPPRPPGPPEPPSAGGRQRNFVGGAFRHLARVGREMLSVTVGRWLDEPEPPLPTPSDDPPAAGQLKAANQRVNLLHNVTEKLRGAADGYIAAKLDEIEARVDAKLNQIEQRIDHKVEELHGQLAEMRDRELRHRLRVLKITLMFTVLVALLSLGYKWIASHWM